MITRTTTTLALLPVLLVALAACGDQGKTDGGLKAGGDDLDGITYVVTGVTEDGRARPLVRDTEIRLRFADGQLGLSAGCNTMGGAYRLEGSSLTVEPLSMTEMGCDQPRMEQDAWVAGLFESPVQLTTGPDAAIISGGTVLSIADRETVSPDVPLVGTKWLLDTMIEGTGPDGAASSVPGDAVAYLEFREGKAFVYDSCNRGSGPAEVTGDAIVFGDRAQTLRGCKGDGRDQVQRAFSEVLAGETTFTIEEKSLRITGGDRALGFRAVDAFPPHD